MTDALTPDSTSTPTSDALRKRITDFMLQAKSDLAKMVSYKSVAVPDTKKDCLDMARHVVELFSAIGFSDMALHDTPDGHPCVFGYKQGPKGSPTVLLYCHYDVQPPLGQWNTSPWELVERGGRWYGRGSADCKGNLVMHLTALRALGDDLPCTVKLIVEGSEEQGTGGLEKFVPENVELLRADAIMMVDTGNHSIGEPTLTTSLRGVVTVDVTVATLRSAVHSGMYGGPAPDPVNALIAMLASLHDTDGNTTIDGLAADGKWTGIDYDRDGFRADATVLDGVDLLGSGAVADMLWARPSVTIIGIDMPSVKDSAPAIQASVKARVSLRIPNGVVATDAQDFLIAHLRARVPWHAKATFDKVAAGDPFMGSLEGPAYDALSAALKESYGRPTTTEGQGGSIPLCNVFKNSYPKAEILLYGVEEPQCLIHAPNESVDPSEIEHIAFAEARFLQRYPRR